MSIMDGLSAENYDRSYSDVQLVKRIVAFFRPHLGKVGLVSLMVTLTSLASIMTSILISRGIDLLGGNPALQLLLALAGVVMMIPFLLVAATILIFFSRSSARRHAAMRAQSIGR